MNQDIIHEILLYLSIDDIKSFLATNKQYQLDKQFWYDKIIYDKLPMLTTDYTLKGYEKLYRLTLEAKEIMLDKRGRIIKINPTILPERILNIIHKEYPYIGDYITIENYGQYNVIFYVSHQKFRPRLENEHEHDYMDDVRNHHKFEMILTRDEMLIMLVKNFKND